MFKRFRNSIFKWIGVEPPPARPPIVIGDDRLATARPGDLVIVTLPGPPVKAVEREHFIEYARELAGEHGVRLWILDGGFAVTVVKSEPQ